MPDQFKLLGQNDIVNQVFPNVNSLLSLTSGTQASISGITLFTAAPYSGSTIFKPDSYGSTTAGLSPSGALNSISKTFFDRTADSFFNSASGVYTLPASHSANINVSCARVISVDRTTLDHGIWPDSLTCVYRYNGTSITAVDSASDSFGPNKESLSYGLLSDSTNSSHILGTIFYDSGIVLLHGGTGTAAGTTISASVTGFAFSGSLTGALSASTSATTIVVDSLAFKTYKMNARNIYFCRLFNNEFNYTSNPSAQNVPFLQDPNNSTTFITRIGLYDNNEALMATASVSPPVRKNASIEKVFAITISL